MNYLNLFKLIIIVLPTIAIRVNGVSDTVIDPKMKYCICLLNISLFVGYALKEFKLLMTYFNPNSFSKSHFIVDGKSDYFKTWN